MISLDSEEGATVQVRGTVDERFLPLEDVFARAVAQQGRGGAALCVYHQGQPVVDLSGGSYQASSVQLLFSVSKLVTAVACAVAAERGLLDLTAPMATYWHEFDRPSTSAITLECVLSHRSGLARLSESLSLEELLANRDEDAIQKQEPYWEPGTAHGYHGFTFGTLVNGAFRRSVGLTLAEFLESEISQPLGLDLWLGIPESEAHRLEQIYYDPPAITPLQRRHARLSGLPQGELARAASGRGDIFNNPAVARACWPAASVTGGARDVARALAATLSEVDGTRLISSASTARMTQTRSRGVDLCLGIQTAFGVGVQRPFPHLPMGGPATFGHEGGGGSLVVCDAERELVAAVTTNVFPSSAGASFAAQSLIGSVWHLIADHGSSDQHSSLMS